MSMELNERCNCVLRGRVQSAIHAQRLVSQLREELAQRDAEVERLRSIVGKESGGTYEPPKGVVGYIRKTELDKFIRSGASHATVGLDSPQCWVDEPPYEHLIALCAVDAHAALESQQAASVGGEREAFRQWVESIGFTMELATIGELKAFHAGAAYQRSTSQPDAPISAELDQYDAGLLNDFGGGNVEWWQDYIRAELGRAHDFYQSQCAALSPAGGGVVPAEFLEHVKHARKELCRADRSPLYIRQKLAQTLTDWLARLNAKPQANSQEGE